MLERAKKLGNEQIASEVGGTPTASVTSALPIRAGGIKVLAIDGAVPIVQACKARVIPTHGRPSTHQRRSEWRSKAFLDFTISAAGQKL